MGRGCRATSSMYFTCTLPAGLAYPFTMFAIVQPRNVTLNKNTIMAVSASGTANDWIGIQMHGSSEASGTGFTAVTSSAAGGLTTAFSAVVGLSTSNYYSVVGIFPDADQRAVLVNGAGYTAETTAGINPSYDTFHLFARNDGGLSEYGNFLNGNFFTIWNIVISVQEAQEWFLPGGTGGQGPFINPWTLHPESIVFGLQGSDQVGTTTTVYDEFQQTAIVPTNGPTVVDDCPWQQGFAA